ncbi:polyisoprenoid-binding protein [Xanthomonas arboricola pv. juglandis]|uniref:YceI family protein n=1 Tax=Xanthomonas TaxID=338 RepID=UPI000E5C14C1|nr:MULTISPECIES: YceI family protein [Xanthomonas]CAD1794050.1 polyisoprenoid-binding protein [Xanthomonas sp. CPBF 426]CAG2092923.1 polyisoprenoid-binding protein [Xanthomonas euroxanthea]CAG2092953.1 polyisoprenoid-binding protein [Xanthomonas euroxanthea]SYZ50415.1 polyisoprenoid-binding protein [Xanthomonas arboricola pv. juglandis]
MTTLARLLLLPALAVTSLAATAAPVRYALDPVHTRVLFAVEHAGFSKALGTVSGSSGTLVFDPDDWAAARLDVTVPLHRADLGDAKWNEATLARNLLDAERFPDAHFVSTQVEASGQNHARVTGNLTLHGVTRPVTLDVTLNALKRHPLPPFRRTAGFSATATLSRAEFGIDAWKSMIGDTVELRIEAEAVREGRADDDAPQPQNAPAADTATSPES